MESEDEGLEEKEKTQDEGMGVEEGEQGGDEDDAEDEDENEAGGEGEDILPENPEERGEEGRNVSGGRRGGIQGDQDGGTGGQSSGEVGEDEAERRGSEENERSKGESRSETISSARAEAMRNWCIGERRENRDRPRVQVGWNRYLDLGGNIRVSDDLRGNEGSVDSWEAEGSQRENTPPQID